MKPCPFCGSADCHPDSANGPDGWEVEVTCRDCNGRGPLVVDGDRDSAADAAIAAWNRRPSPKTDSQP